MRDLTKNRLMRIIYILIVVGAFWSGHKYGEQAAVMYDDLPIPKVSFEMPSASQ
jgi:hypothetical protein|tara:strand:+ start:1151 stop:1312 length:162 start_codon:yes stop_codon:yes gene_type:complete